ncbi:Calcineurin family phosphoesterase [Deinococcus geothermalis DSM 11300]|uniref:Calcineurin family phosphoesterase n=1 Tax=Deinococcus geothermalis (strain DSM 11300 / CIP 105573 / AG-3a) TaxID=319795 RepID=Q1J1Z2_DEIGD|nr:metallophosphoesterase [Deinococcus geothermalis]ABF44492.1 Calcineurin family phosphoesterase [Deinococcus geothermalis DSM 11300]MBI0445695.1 metallophosphoesterase [Deinococcus sp. DB0503]
MQKFIAVGDVHADWAALWAALRAASCADADLRPTLPVQLGLYQVVLIGDLVHPKSEHDYARLTGLSRFDPRNPDHLFLAAREQVRHLEQLRAYQATAPHAVHILLGNHDDAVLNLSYVLGTSGGLVHVEFDPARGGLHLPDHLRTWMQGFPRELRVGSVQFAHVSPLPAHTHYDDLFYADPSPKRWFRDHPEYVRLAGLSFGVYGHTQLESGVLLNEAAGFAMIDVLHRREYLELLLDRTQPQPVQSVRAVPF